MSKVCTVPGSLESASEVVVFCKELKIHSQKRLGYLDRKTFCICLESLQGLSLLQSKLVSKL
jgi:hypothetical protein